MDAPANQDCFVFQLKDVSENAGKINNINWETLNLSVFGRFWPFLAEFGRFWPVQEKLKSQNLFKKYFFFNFEAIQGIERPKTDRFSAPRNL